MLPKQLYRGVKESMHRSTGGILAPKQIGGARETVFDRSGNVPRTRGADPRDLGAVRDYSVVNTVLLQQLRQQGYPTSFVSTTPHQANAEKYALYAEDTGVIYVIDTDRLAAGGVEAVIVADFVPVPSVPGDEEILLRAANGGALPSHIVIAILPVKRPGAPV
jgi:hypothetical protein